MKTGERYDLTQVSAAAYLENLGDTLNNVGATATIAFKDSFGVIRVMQVELLRTVIEPKLPDERVPS